MCTAETLNMQRVCLARPSPGARCRSLWSQHLIKDVLSEIAARLDPEDKVKLPQVCQSWKELITHAGTLSRTIIAECPAAASFCEHQACERPNRFEGERTCIGAAQVAEDITPLQKKAY